MLDKNTGNNNNNNDSNGPTTDKQDTGRIAPFLRCLSADYETLTSSQKHVQLTSKYIEAKTCHVSCTFSQSTEQHMTTNKQTINNYIWHNRDGSSWAGATSPGASIALHEHKGTKVAKNRRKFKAQQPIYICHKLFSARYLRSLSICQTSSTLNLKTYAANSQSTKLL